MYECLIQEFGVDTKFLAPNGLKIYQDRYSIFDEEYKTIFSLNENCYTSSFCFDLFWVCYKDTEGELYSYGIELSSWNIVVEKKHRVDERTVSIDNNWYVCDGDPECIRMYDCQGGVVTEKNPGNVYSKLFCKNDLLYAVLVGGGILCFNKSLELIWKIETEKSCYSSDLSVADPIFYENLLILNLGEDKTIARGNFEINAYEYDTGKLVWQQIVETSPQSSHLVGDKLYVCVNNRFRRINALTGTVEIDKTLDIKKFDGALGVLSAVYPIGDQLLFSSKENSILEFRTADAEHIVQTILLPESYSYSGERSPVFFNDEIYLSLDHVQMIPFNVMKSGIAVLTPSASTKKNEAATLEPRVPYVLEPVKDDKGNNATLIRMNGSDDSNKIIHSAHVVLKEIAVRTGVTWGIEFETRDPNHGGKLYLEIDISDLEPKTNTKEQWLEIFNVIKTRIDEELFNAKVVSGNKKYRYRVILSLV